MKMKRTSKINLPSDLKWLHGLLAIAVVSILVFAGTVLGAEKNVLLKMELPPPEVPQPQLFCGYCHVLTYPGVVQKGYDLWKKGKHNKVGCVECHYPPKASASRTSNAIAGNVTKASHIPAQPPGHFSYLPLGGNTIQTRPKITDSSCMTAACHGKPDDKFKTKKIKFTEKVPFVHKPHLDKKKQIEGQIINCTSCHQHETEKKKFEVSKASCHLCHFKNVKFNESRGRCELCHQLPKKPIQTSGQKPITHEMLKKEKVSCGSCHYQIIQSSGRAEYEAYFEKGLLKTALLLKSGDIKKENCLSCHDRAKALKEVTNKKLMHEKHVTIKTARCFDCHQPIKHKLADFKGVKEEASLFDKKASEKIVRDNLMREGFIRDSCLTCHHEPHRLQRQLAMGSKREGVPESRSFHLNARANCMACHLEEGVTKKGEKIMKASAKSCVMCHKGRKGLLKDWKTELSKEVEYTQKVEKEALKALAIAKAKLPKPKKQLAEAREMLKKGQETFNMVRFGNGVHNKKYSMFLLDAAITNFEDLKDYLEEAE